MTMIELASGRFPDRTQPRSTPADSRPADLVASVLRFMARVGMAVAAGRFTSSIGGIGPWAC
jgi:hypothetical protein